tara:strand:- start:4187 stop:5131 length:945 start_codon:yes stop_codon:yes gene_type:complete
MADRLSVIIPVFNEALSLERTIKDLLFELDSLGIGYDVTLIDDGSIDDSWLLIEKLANKHGGVIRGIKLSKNFGKDSAILAGLQNIESDLYLIVDADGEHPFEMIGEFYGVLVHSGCDVVNGVKGSRRGSVFYKFLSRVFNKVFASLAGLDLAESSDFKLFNRKFRDALLGYGDCDYFFRGVAKDVGFKSENVVFDERTGVACNSSWTIKGLVVYAWNSIINFSHFPLYFILLLGFSSILLALGVGVKILIVIGSDVVPDGYLTLLFLSLISFGMIMSSIGVIGVYLSKIFDAIKSRPRFIIESKVVGGESESI